MHSPLTRSRVRVLSVVLVPLVVPAAILAGYGVWAARAESFFFPPLPAIGREFADTWLFERIPGDFVPSMARMLSGYALSVVVGVALGTLLGLSRIVRTAAEPVIEFLRALPAPALIPFTLLVLGTGDDAKVFLIVLGSIWPILLNTLDGVRGVESEQLDMARAYRIPPGARLFRIVLPAASPRIFAGMRTSLSIALILMVISEMVASTNGIGYFVLQAQRSFAIPEMWGGIVLLGLLGFGLNWLFLRVEDRVLFWHRGARGLLGERQERARTRRAARPQGNQTTPPTEATRA
jgi:ABC-type nitrate/sulfonate/bicarbonate transport system permease component